MASRRLFAIAVLGAGPACAIGCSLVNTFDDVKPQVASDGGGGDATADQVSPTTDSGTDTSSPVADAADAADAAEAGPPPSPGAIVVGGSVAIDGGTDYVLAVLDPRNGSEIAQREHLKVAGIQYDGLRDLWYIFESKGASYQNTPTDAVDLHVRSFDAATGKWTEKAKVGIPGLYANDGVVVLRERIAYVAYTTPDGGPPGFQLAVLDTSNPSSPTIASQGTLLSTVPSGMVGTRSATAAAGGTVDFLQLDTTSCVGDGGIQDICTFNLIPVSIPAGSAPVFNPPKAVGAVPKLGSAGGGSYLGGGPDTLIAFPPVNGQPAYIEHFASTGISLGQKVDFSDTGPFLKPVAVSECFNMAFVVELRTDSEVFGVPIAGGSTPVIQKGTGHAGQAVRFEPYTNTVLAPFSAAGEITAFALTGTPSAPVLTRRQAPGWLPPGDILPNFVTVKQPIPFACP